MEPAVLISVGIVALIVLPFILAVLAFRPLINSLADRIGGRKTGAKEIKDLKQKLMLLQDEVADLRGKVMGMEDDYHFAQKMLEDMENRPERKKTNLAKLTAGKAVANEINPPITKEIRIIPS